MYVRHEVYSTPVLEESVRVTDPPEVCSTLTNFREVILCAHVLWRRHTDEQASGEVPEVSRLNHVRFRTCIRQTGNK
ncbi:hypothetical protein NDU88_003045 [Pleurodeles waltl]|uniref:Uncharacterized protein n=1 Tax=Pleurodeles waltl TaxID=8319 RepID=A0AAV7MSA7_PLEWA|nr:hypothetical protein NDU88_003045 [Pleurodeles waltl]